METETVKVLITGDASRLPDHCTLPGRKCAPGMVHAHVRGGNIVDLHGGV
jgi:hypothetical protein